MQGQLGYRMVMLTGSKVSAFDGDITIPSVAIRDGDVWYAKIKVNDGEVDSDWFTTQDVTIGSDNTPPVLQSVSIPGGPFTTVDDIQANFKQAMLTMTP